MLQRLRLRRSESTTVPVFGRVALPTAVHVRAVAQETPKRKLLVTPLGAGTGWMAQRAPFQRSASGSGAPAALTA